MHSFSIFFFSLAFLTLFATAQSDQSTTLPCYQTSCSPLIDLLKECQITVDSSTGNVNFPVQPNTTITTDKCLCKQIIVNAYDPCFNCGAQNQKIQDRYSTQKLVDSCNVNFGANTVKMPSASSATARTPLTLSWTVLVATVVAVAMGLVV
ncbi:hypothetical protein BGX27_007946 [Mortierella sp. AM989]|nr:hypothetical protein BGX27_007946 [Mortierella sp. AM989]